MRIVMTRVASLMIALTCLTIAWLSATAEVFHLVLAIIVVPLGLIWYGREIGTLVCSAGEECAVDGKAIGMLVMLAGWFGLATILAIVALTASPA